MPCLHLQTFCAFFYTRIIQAITMADTNVDKFSSQMFPLRYLRGTLYSKIISLGDCVVKHTPLIARDRRVWRFVSSHCIAVYLSFSFFVFCSSKFLNKKNIYIFHCGICPLRVSYVFFLGEPNYKILI